VKRVLALLLLLCLYLYVFPGVSAAQDGEQKTRRIEAFYAYEHLTPHDDYGSWHTLNLAYYDQLRRDFTYFLSLYAYSRDEGDAMLGNAGAYKDWSPSLYTYTSLSAGSNSDYLPKFRIDHDFNVKFGPAKSLVWVLGVAYIDYYDVHEDFILSTGIVLYAQDWIVNYRLFRNDSSPGDAVSYSHLISTGYGREKWQWTYLNLSFGKQAYYATQLTNPEEVSQSSLFVGLKHRRWLGKDYGVFFDVSFFKLKDGYEKYGFSPGVFKEF
jgi:YaiO family outer membrane protein